MIRLKTPEEIEKLATGGKILAAILTDIATAAKAGIKTKELNELALALITQHGVAASFLHYAPPGHTPFPAALCVSVNAAVVHGLPGQQVLREGDLVGLDLGIIYEGFYLDAARTIAVGSVSSAATRLLAVTHEALVAGIAAARVGNTVGDISHAIQTTVEQPGNDFGIVRELVGHGVGYAVHEEPKVPNYRTAKRGPKLENGLVIAIEPMITFGDPAIQTSDDGWTIETRSGALAAHEEHTVAVTLTGPRILTSM